MIWWLSKLGSVFWNTLSIRGGMYGEIVFSFLGGFGDCEDSECGLWGLGLRDPEKDERRRLQFWSFSEQEALQDPSDM